MTEILDESAVSEIEARYKLASKVFPYREVNDSLDDIPALCATVKHLRERVQLLDSRWCECGHTKDKHGFFSDHDECYECDQSSPDQCCEWRPVARPDTQLEHLQSQLEQLRAENHDLRKDNENLSSAIFNNQHARSAISRAIQLCKSKADGYRQGAEGNLARETWIDRAEVAENLATELEKL